MALAGAIQEGSERLSGAPRRGPGGSQEGPGGFPERFLSHVGPDVPLGPFLDPFWDAPGSVWGLFGALYRIWGVVFISALDACMFIDDQ